MISLSSILLEGKYDFISRKITSDILRKIKSNHDKQISFENQYVIWEDLDSVIVRCKIYRKKSIEFPVDIYGLHDYNESLGQEVIKLTITFDSTKEPQIYNDLYFEIFEAINHEIQHIIDEDFEGIMVPRVRRNARVTDNESTRYLLNPSEISAFVTGFHNKARKRRTNFKDEISKYLDAFVKSNKINEYDKNFIYRTWLDFHKKKYRTNF